MLKVSLNINFFNHIKMLFRSHCITSFYVLGKVKKEPMDSDTDIFLGDSEETRNNESNLPASTDIRDVSDPSEHANDDTKIYKTKHHLRPRPK